MKRPKLPAISVLLYFILFGTVIVLPLSAQENLMDLLNEDSTQTINYSQASFKCNRLLLGQSVETLGKNDFIFAIAHHFGSVTNGITDLFGLDYATTRFGFDYGLTQSLSIGIGRSNYLKLYDGYVKYKILRQQTGKKNLPVTITYYGSVSIVSMEWDDPTKDYQFLHRMDYAHILLIARKFNSKFSAQLMPAFVHRNLVVTEEDPNNLISVGIGGRYKFTRLFSVSGEYYYLLPIQTTDKYKNCLTVGVDLETGGHIFQLYLSNSRGTTEQYFIGDTHGSWLDGDIFFGFTISRIFSFNRKKTEL